MRYIVTICKFERLTRPRQEYVKLADTGNTTDGKAVYGYVTRQEETDVEAQVYRQEFVEREGVTLNIEGIVRFLNGEQLK